MSSAAGLSKRRKEEVTEEAEDEEADHPVDGVDVNDDHVHVQAPAPSVVPEVQAVQLVASSPGQRTPRHGSGLPLEAWQTRANISHRFSPLSPRNPTG